MTPQSWSIGAILLAEAVFLIYYRGIWDSRSHQSEIQGIRYQGDDLSLLKSIQIAKSQGESERRMRKKVEVMARRIARPEQNVQ